MKSKYLSQLKRTFSEFLFKDFQPYSYLSKSCRSYQSVSNLFPVIMNDSLKTRYVFDNAPFLFERFNSNSIKHLITIYNRDGVISASREITCDLPLLNINLIDIHDSDNFDFGSFTHHIKRTNGIKDDIVFHLRGYTYYSSVSSDLETMCHGNFGGIALDYANNFISLSKQRSIFTYTTQLILDISKQYSFYWNNPTNSPLKVKMISHNFENLSEHIISPKGTAIFKLDSYKGLVHFQSRLPIGRPVILISNGNGFIDALHG